MAKNKPRYRKPNGKPTNKSNTKPKAKQESKEVEEEKMDTSRGNNPAWYFLDEKLAEQVSQMSFQNLAGYPINYDGHSFEVPNIVRIHLNPAPGVQVSARYNTPLAQNSAINMAAFRIYSKLSAYTGRVQSYAPQDVGTMILAYGEIISCVEDVRRMFGVSYTMSYRNRAYPKAILQEGMQVDADDLFANLSNYRTQFNTLITLINQLPIPKNIAYFDKCARLYQRVLLDSPSAMAQTLIPVPHSTWILDESSYSGGTVLKTYPLHCAASFGPLGTTPTMAYYLNTLAALIGALLNSSSLQVVYTDLLNYASKVGCEFWKFDYLFEDYQVIPEYDENFMLQMHNATLCGAPVLESSLITGAYNVTPYNDVYPDPNRNCLFYNPAFSTVQSVVHGHARTGDDVIIDMMTDMPTLTDRIEVTRYASVSKGTPYQPTGASGQTAYIDAALPDHYVVYVNFQNLTGDLTYYDVWETVIPEARFRDISALVANIDWAPRFFEINSSTNYTGRYTSDVNFYTVVDEYYLRKLHDFVGLALYDLR